MKTYYILIDKDTGEAYGSFKTKQLAEQEKRDYYNGRHIIGDNNPNDFILIRKIEL